MFTSHREHSIDYLWSGSRNALAVVVETISQKQQQNTDLHGINVKLLLFSLNGIIFLLASPDRLLEHSRGPDSD